MPVAVLIIVKNLHLTCYLLGATNYISKFMYENY
jgi:hypothetical protein